MEDPLYNLATFSRLVNDYVYSGLAESFPTLEVGAQKGRTTW